MQRDLGELGAVRIYCVKCFPLPRAPALSASALGKPGVTLGLSLGFCSSGGQGNGASTRPGYANFRQTKKKTQQKGLKCH